MSIGAHAGESTLARHAGKSFFRRSLLQRIDRNRSLEAIAPTPCSPPLISVSRRSNGAIPPLRSPRRAHPHGLKHQRAAQRIGGTAIETVAGPADPAAPAPRPPRAIRPIVSPATS
ncbi:hypothetical protein [Burkholderia mallei]|uniref:hypothetical protein n=1 Tax=Burkholderia mallei TaxID=13373 RepID=UPI0012ED4358|nr:hypothetical protein [Burkholderia mallei]